MGREWGTTLVDRPHPTNSHMRMPATDNLETAMFDFPSSGDERIAPPTRKTNGKTKVARDPYDVPSDDEDLAVKIAPAKRKRPVESVPAKKENTTTSSKIQPVPMRSTKSKPKPAATGSVDVAPRTTLLKAKVTNKAVAPHRSKESPASPQLPAAKKKRISKTDVFDFPDSGDDDDAKSVVSTASRVRRARSKTPATTTIRTAPSTGIKRPRAASTLDTQRSSRASSVTNGNGLRTTTIKSRMTKVTKVARSRASSRARATKSPAESLASTRSRAKTPSTLRAAIKKSSSAPEPLTHMISEHASRSQTPYSVASPTSVMSPIREALRTPSPSAIASPRTALRAESMTPRQTALWNKLLDDSDSEGEEEVTVTRLQLNSVPRRAPEAPADTALRNGTTRTRLVDALKATQTIDDESSSEEDSDEADDDTMQMDSVPATHVSHTVTHTQTTRVTYGLPRTQATQSQVEETEDGMFDLLMDDPIIEQPPQDIFDEGLETDDETSQPRNIHDLKAAGHKKRIEAELAHLLDGIKGGGMSSLGAQRSDLLELSKKLTNTSNLGTFLDRGWDHSLITAISKSDDLILQFLAAICIRIIVDSSSSTITTLRTIHRSKYFEHLIGLLGQELSMTRILRDRKTNMSKIMQQSISEYLSHLAKSDNWQVQSSREFSPRLVSLTTTERLIRKMRELGSEEVLLQEKSIASLLSVLDDFLPSSSQAQELDLVFSALESSSIGKASTAPNIWTSNALKRLTPHASTIISLADSSSSRSTRLLVLRLTINLSNNNPRACDIFASSPFILGVLCRINTDFASLTSLEDASSIMDELILSLGALINLAELSDAARSQVLSDEGKVLKQAVATFSSKQDSIQETESVEASTLNVPYGYLALLLVNLCQNTTVRTQILQYLPAGALDALIFAAEEFIAIHQKTDREMFAGDGEVGEVYQSYTNRLMGMVRKLKEVARIG